MASFKEQMETFSTKAEDILDTVGQPLKPYIPAMSRFLIVATFIEDSLRIIMQWSDQLTFMQQSRGFPTGLSHLFLGLNVIVSEILKKIRGMDRVQRRRGVTCYTNSKNNEITQNHLCSLDHAGFFFLYCSKEAASLCYLRSHGCYCCSSFWLWLDF